MPRQPKTFNAKCAEPLGKASRRHAAQLGYGYRWLKYSRRFRREHPLCVRCGRVAELVDHIKPVIDESDPLFWLPSNHQSLCWSCHSVKTADDKRKGLTRQN